MHLLQFLHGPNQVPDISKKFNKEMTSLISAHQMGRRSKGMAGNQDGEDSDSTQSEGPSAPSAPSAVRDVPRGSAQRGSQPADLVWVAYGEYFQRFGAPVMPRDRFSTNASGEMGFLVPRDVWNQDAGAAAPAPSCTAIIPASSAPAAKRRARSATERAEDERKLPTSRIVTFAKQACTRARAVITAFRDSKTLAELPLQDVQRVFEMTGTRRQQAANRELDAQQQQVQ